MASLTFLLISSSKEWRFHIATDLSSQEWKFHIPTYNLWSKMSISPCYSHLVVKSGNFTLLLTYSGQEMLLTPSVQEWQFHIPICN